MHSTEEVAIIGAGLAGLNCARRLHQQGIPFRIFEASSSVGGRVKTDVIDGFRLDHGFQIYLTAYPEGQKCLDYDALELCHFKRGAKVWYNGRFHRLTDPLQEPWNLLNSAFNPIGTFRDKWKLIWFHLEMSKEIPPPTNPLDEDGLTLDLLRWKGAFSEAMIDRFFRPFFGGVFLERNLMTSKNFFRFVYRMFSQGAGTVPKKGMQEIPKQLAQQLPWDRIHLEHPIQSVENQHILFQDGTSTRYRAIVLATDRSTCERLLPNTAFINDHWNSTITLYFSAKESPLGEPILAINGEKTGIVNHLAVMSDCSEEYAPAGKSLIAANIVGCPDQPEEQLVQSTKTQLTKWFGPEVQEWELLKAYRIEKALPRIYIPLTKYERIKPGLYRCGDYLRNPSINGALESGFAAAQHLLEDLQLQMI